MNNEIFRQFHSSRPELSILVQYINVETKQTRLIYLVKKIEEYVNIEPIKKIGDILKLNSSILNEKELQFKKHLEGFDKNTRIDIIKNTFITYESTLIDTKKSITIILSQLLKKTILQQELYLEETNTRRPVENYISGMKVLESDISKIEVSELLGETVYIDDILLKNIPIDTKENICKLNVYNFSDFVNAIKSDRNDLLKENKTRLYKFLNNYWIKLEIREIKNRFEKNSFNEDYIEENVKDLLDFSKISNTEADFNENLWKAKINEGLFKQLGIYFNSFILENKENITDNKIDIYSVFKYFELDDKVPFSRYSYGGQVGQKMVKIYEKFYSIENIAYLEKWNHITNYKETPANCVQWKGFYNYNDDSIKTILEYELLLFQDGTYQVRLYQQRINLIHIEKFLEFLKNTILEKVKYILSNIGIKIVLNDLKLAKNIHFIFSKLEINITLVNEIELGKLQNILNKSNFLFSKAGDIISNEFINLEFRKVNNHTRSDQIQKYINHYMIQNRITEVGDVGPIIKVIMSKYSKSQLEATQIIKTWISKFVDSENQQNNKIKITKNIGLEVIGKQIGTHSCNFYMSNVTELEDIYTFFYYLIILINISQLKENILTYNEIIGRKQDEKLLAKAEVKKEKEQKVETEVLDELDDLVFEDPTEDDYLYVTEDPVDDLMSVHSEPVEEELVAVEKEGTSELPQEDIIDELEPITNGSSYYIKRLQLMDKEVYDYKVDSKFKPYSKKAMPNDSRQPIVLTNRQMDKVKAKYGDDTNVYGGIRKDIDVYSKDYKADSYSIKYRNLHYICPKVWCMKDQMPYYMDQLKENGTKSGFAAVGYNEKGEYLLHPTKVTCPDCGNGVWGVDKSGTLLIAQDNLKRQPYPGFFTADQHPKNLCMVTCFKRPNQKIQECLASDKPIKVEKRVSNEKYILKGDKYGKCGFGRYCVLPEKIHNWLNADFGNYKLERVINDEYISYLRKGILKETDEYYESFEKTIQYLLGDSVAKLTKQEFRSYLVERLKKIPDILKIFKKARRGSLYLYFGKDIEHYYSYILDSISLQPKFILPILSSPNVLSENGINFYIIKEENGGVFLECEYFNYEYLNNYEQADNMFIYSHVIGESYKKTYYEPIVLVQQKSKNLQITRTVNGSNRITMELLKYVKTECINKEDPWITQLKRMKPKGPISEEEYFLEKQPTIKVLEKIDTNPEYQILLQYMNEYNQTEGLIVKWISKGKKFYIPIKPIEMLDNIRIIRNRSLIEVHSLEETKEFLEIISEKSKIDYTPYFYTKNSDGLISGIYTLTGQWIPVLYKNIEGTNLLGLNEWKYPKDIWIQKRKETDDREIAKKSRDEKHLNYEKLRFELSYHLKKNNTLKEQILERMRSYKMNLTLEQKQYIRKQLIEILSNFLRSNVVLPGVIGAWNIKDVFKYCSDNKTIQECNSISMCGWKDECRMIINPEWYWKFITRLVDDLLVNVNKKKEIINEYRKELEIPENEILFYTKEEIDDYLQKYDLDLENKKYLYHPLEHFDYTNPKHKLQEEFIIEKSYTLPKYLLNLFNRSLSDSPSSYSPKNNYSPKAKDKYDPKKTITLYNSKDPTSNYFFNTLSYLVKSLPRKNIPIRIELSNRIKMDKTPKILLDRYKSLSDNEYGEIYRRFKAMKSIDNVAEYVKETSWGSIIDIELLADIFESYKLKFIIIEDTGNPYEKNLFIHLPNQILDKTSNDLKEYKYGILVVHQNIFELLQYNNNPLFEYEQIPFIQKWIEKQIAYEKSMPY